MTTSRRIAGRKVARFEKNITMRGIVGEASKKKGYSEYIIGAVVIFVVAFVVFGSSLIQVIKGMA